MINCRSVLLPLGGGGVVWTKLQEVLSSVEDSISSKRSWAAPITALDHNKHREHLRAAQESWVKAAQVLKLTQTLFSTIHFFHNSLSSKIRNFLEEESQYPAAF